MGLTRKIMSVSTLGAVDYRSDKERTAAYTKAAKKQAKEQTKLLKQQNEIIASQQYAAPAPTAPVQAAAPVPPPPAVPAGWYPDPSGQPVQRYWDGARWTDNTAPLAP